MKTMKTFAAVVVALGSLVATPVLACPHRDHAQAEPAPTEIADKDKPAPAPTPTPTDVAKAKDAPKSGDAAKPAPKTGDKVSIK